MLNLFLVGEPQTLRFSSFYIVKEGEVMGEGNSFQSHGLYQQDSEYLITIFQKHWVRPIDPVPMQLTTGPFV